MIHNSHKKSFNLFRALAADLTHDDSFIEASLRRSLKKHMKKYNFTLVFCAQCSLEIGKFLRNKTA